MRKAIVAGVLLYAGTALAAFIPTQRYTTEMTDTLRYRQIKSVQGATEDFYWTFTQGGTPVQLTNSGTTVKFTFENESTGWEQTITGSVDSATNAYWQFTPSTVNTNGTFYFNLRVAVGSVTMIRAIGNLILESEVGVTNTLTSTTNVDWQDYTYDNTASSGPYRASTNIEFSTANTDGSVNVTAMDAVDPTTAGRMIYADGTNWVVLGIGSNGQRLKVSGGLPTWADSGPGNTNNITNVLAGAYIDVTTNSASSVTVGLNSSITDTQTLHNTWIGTVSNDLDTLEAAYAVTSNELDVIESAYATSSNLLDNVVTTQTLYTTWIGTVSNDLDTLEAAYAVTSNDLDTAKTTIGNLASTSSLHTAWCGTVSNDLDTLEADYATSSNLLDNVVSTQATLQAAVDALPASTNIPLKNAANTFYTDQTIEQDKIGYLYYTIKNDYSALGLPTLRINALGAETYLFAVPTNFATAAELAGNTILSHNTAGGDVIIQTDSGAISLRPSSSIDWTINAGGSVNGYGNTWSNFVIGGDIDINAGQLTNQYRTLTWTVQDPTNSIAWPLFHPADGDGDWTIAEVSCWVNGGDVTGLCHWVVGDVPLTTGGTSVETGVTLGATRVVDSSLSGFTTISNDQAIAIYLTELSEFDATNVVNATVRLTK